MQAGNVEARLAHLETSLRRTRLALVSVALVGILALTGGSLLARASSDAITARAFTAHEFNVIDERGRVRASLFLTADGPALTLLDELGRGRASLFLTADGPALALADERGRDRASLFTTADGPALALYDERGWDRASLFVYEGHEGLALSDAFGRVSFGGP